MADNQQSNFLHSNGDTVESTVTGFKGKITARADHLHGCNRYYVVPPVDKDGKLPDGYWMDEAELKVLKKHKRLERKNNDRGGFPSQVK